MLSLNELVDIRMQQHIAQEIYRQQIMQRIPDPFSSMLPMHMPHHVIMPPRPTLPNVNAKLENNDLWQQFHKIGTEMIITKTGRRMFPSQRLSLSGLEEEASYCVLLEMLPTGDCRYKFSGSQWVPAGGAEPQSPQRMYLHPDSPATGAHWQSQPILFNKVKLTNNTLDHIGHIVLASMHKYQPRIHVIRTSDLTQIPWAPQQAFVFPETEFVAVTAYQNDRITKLKIDNNPFAKGFRETGQSRCKRKLSAAELEQQSGQNDVAIPATSPSRSICSNNSTDDDRSSVSSCEVQQVKRPRSSGSLDDAASLCSSNGSNTTRFDDCHNYAPSTWLQQQQQALHHMQLSACPMPLELTPPSSYFLPTPAMRPMFLDTLYNTVYAPQQQIMASAESVCLPQTQLDAATTTTTTENSSTDQTPSLPATVVRSANKRSNFSISAILAH